MKISHVDLAGQTHEPIRLGATRKRLLDLQRGRVEAARVAEVVWERLAGSGVANLNGTGQAEEAAEIAAQHFIVRNKGHTGVPPNAFRGALVVAEDKQSIAEEGAAERPAELIPLEPVP